MIRQLTVINAVEDEEEAVAEVVVEAEGVAEVEAGEDADEGVEEDNTSSTYHAYPVKLTLTTSIPSATTNGLDLATGSAKPSGPFEI